MNMMKTDAYIKFKECILTGQLRPGQFVTQRELCDLIDVPIAPAREAIQRLEHETLLKVYPKRGIQISDISPRLIRNAYQVRIIIEKEAVGLFVENAPVEVIDDIRTNSQAILERAERSELTPDLLSDLDKIDEGFHNTIVEYLDNEILSKTFQINQARIRLIRVGNKGTGDRKIPAMREHIDILNACHNRELSRAVALLEQHLKLSRRRAMDGC